jgi:hypothetical protein
MKRTVEKLIASFWFSVSLHHLNVSGQITRCRGESRLAGSSDLNESWPRVMTCQGGDGFRLPAPVESWVGNQITGRSAVG